MPVMEYQKSPVKPKAFVRRKFMAKQLTEKQIRDIKKLSTWRVICHIGQCQQIIYKRHEIGILQLLVAATFVAAILRHI